MEDENHDESVQLQPEKESRQHQMDQEEKHSDGNSKHMYKNKKMNQMILIGSAVVFFLMFWMIQNQTGISDVSWMRSMIPHHSSAIMTSENANITDPEVRKLADEIIQAQEKEIAEMRQMIEKLQSQPKADLSGSELNQ